MNKLRAGHVVRLWMIGTFTAIVLNGCAAQSRQKLLAFFFDGTQTPPPTRRVRRDLLKEIDDLKSSLAEAKQVTAAKAAAEMSAGGVAPAVRRRPPIEQAKTWEEASRGLSKDPTGRVDWMRALREGAIAPRPALEDQLPVQAVFDLDTALSTGEHDVNRVTFSHASHTTWMTCENCHPTVFPLKRSAGPAVVTMEKIRQKQFCGACHGTVAFGTSASCLRCHTTSSNVSMWQPSKPPAKAIETLHRWEEAGRLLPTALDGSPDWTAALVRDVIAPRPGIEASATAEEVLDADIVREPPGAKEYKVVFPHKAHTLWLKCDSCHPSPFEMQAGATPMSMDRVNAGELCGRCHGTVAFPVTSCARCHPAMEGGS